MKTKNINTHSQMMNECNCYTYEIFNIQYFTIETDGNTKKYFEKKIIQMRRIKMTNRIHFFFILVLNTHDMKVFKNNNVSQKKNTHFNTK